MDGNVIETYSINTRVFLTKIQRPNQIISSSRSRQSDEKEDTAYRKRKMKRVVVRKAVNATVRFALDGPHV